MTRLFLYTPTNNAVALQSPAFKLAQQEEQLSGCTLTFESSLDLYTQIESEALFNLYPEILKGQTQVAFTADLPLQVTLVLGADLLSDLASCLASPQPDTIGPELEQLDKTHPLLSTDSWFATSIWQEQPSGRCGYETLWSLIVAEGRDPESQRQQGLEFLEQFLKTATGNNLSSLFEQIEVLQEIPAFKNLQQSTTTADTIDTNTIDTDTFPAVLKELAQAIEALSEVDLWQDLSPPESEGQASSSVSSPPTEADSSEATQSEASQRIFLEAEGVRLSASVLWRLQKQFFSAQSPRADRSDAIAFNPAHSSTLAFGYAGAIAAFLQDCLAVTKRHKTNFAVLDKTEPVYILELGAGTGRFAYRLLRQLQPLLARPGLKKLKVKYVLTDFVPQNLDFWQNHDALQPWFERGSLDVAAFDLQHPDAIALRHSNKILTPDTLVNPLIVIANDVFSCLPQDAYYLESGVIYEDRVSLSAPAGTDLERWQSLAQFSLHYEQRPLERDRTSIPDLVAQYGQHCDRSHILWPTVALTSLDFLRTLANDRLMAISSDVAYCHEIALQGNGEPIPNCNGYVALPVNYHALADYSQRQGGQALQPERVTPGFSTQILLFGNHPTGFRETQASYHHLDLFTSSQTALLLDPLIANQIETLSLSQLVTYLQSRHWDAEVFLACFSALLPHLEHASAALGQDLIQGAHQVWQGYYPLGEDRDLAFYLGMILYSLGDCTSAVDYFERSRQSHGDDASTLYNLAMSHYQLQHLEQALDYLDRTLAVDPTFEAARNARAQWPQEFNLKN